MGLFQHRPEDPTEWAGLPSEPLDDESVAERLPDSASADAGLADLTGLFGTGAATSVVVPLTGSDGPASGGTANDPHETSDEGAAPARVEHPAPTSLPPQSHP